MYGCLMPQESVVLQLDALLPVPMRCALTHGVLWSGTIQATSGAICMLWCKATAGECLLVQIRVSLGRGNAILHLDTTSITQHMQKEWREQ